nr:reverse transcriptase domain-containing protein [Tanacetum cinerariifolium]
MADQRTMAQLLQAPTEGYEDAIVVLAITADNFELKHELHQLDTFYNALNSKDQDSLNFAAGGNFLDKMPRECLAIIKSKSKVHYSRNKLVVAKVSTNTSTSGISPDVVELKDMVKALLLDKKSQNQSPAPVKAVEESCVTCGGAHSYRNCPATDGNVYREICLSSLRKCSTQSKEQSKPFHSKSNRGNNFNQGPVYQPSVFQPLPYQAPAPQIQGVSKEDFLACVKFVNSNSASTSNSGTLPSNTIANPRSDLKAITTRSGVSYDGPQISPPPYFLPKVVENEPEATNDTLNPTNNGSTEDVQPQVSASKPNQKTLIPYPSRRNNERNRKKANNQIEKFYQIFKHMSFEISFVNALILMPKFASTLKALIGNKEKLSEIARTLLNEHCSAVLRKKLPENLGDPGKFMIPCDFSGMAECLALADLGASINLMPFCVWKRLSLLDLTPTCMTLELSDRSISRSVGVAEDVYVKVGSFHFPANFVVVDFNDDPRVPLILGRSFLKTGRALIDVFEVELTLRVGKEAITFNLDQTSRYSTNYSDMAAKRIDVINMACEEYSQEVLGFSDTISSGNPTPFYDPIVSTTSPILTPFENSYFLLEEVDAFLAIEDEPSSPEFHQPYIDPEGDILLLEAFLNDDPSLPPPNQGNYLPEVHKKLKIYEAKSDKSSVDEPLEVKLKDLPPHLEYAFLEGDDKLPIIIAKDLSVEEKTTLITVLKSHKRSITWKLSNIKGIDPELCTHKILMEEDFEPAKLNEATHKDHFPLPFMDQMLERLAGNQYYCFLDGFSGYFQIPIDPKDQEKTTFIAHTERLLITACLLGYALLHARFRAPILIAPDWDMPFELMCNASDFSIGAFLGQRQDKHFRPIYYASKTMTEAESNYTMTEKEMLAVEFTFKVIDTKGVENLAADHLSRLENPHQNVLDPKEINESFPLETLNLVSTRGENRVSCLDKLDDALWAFWTAYKTLIGCTPYKLVYEKACHLPVELEHKAYWAFKHANFNLKTVGDHRKVQINDLNELRDQAYENSLIYKEKTKRLHDSKIKNGVFNIGDRVILFNSRLKIFFGKLKSRWSGQFTISQVYPYGTVELSQPDEHNFKVNGHRLKHYFGEDVPKLVVPDLQTFPMDH